jgi:hypothetical protein
MKTTTSTHLAQLGKLAIGCATCAAITLGAYASVVLNLSTGTGYVGKGDVQLAFGWNNKQLQDAVQANAISFTYVVSESYDVTCEWTTGSARNPTTHSQTKTTSADVTAAVTYTNKNSSSGKNGDFTGFNLVLGALTISGDAQVGSVPSVGDPCPGFDGNGKTVTAVGNVTAGSGGLFVNYGTTSVLLPPTVF